MKSHLHELLRTWVRGTAPRSLIGFIVALREIRRDLVRSRYRGKEVIRNIEGITYELDLNEGIDSSLYFDGYYERSTTRFLTAFVNEGMTVFEVGANVGSHTLLMGRLAGSGQVYAFEPTTYAFRKLQRNLNLNTFLNVRAERLALSDQPGERVICGLTDKSNLPFKASWRRRGKSATANTTDVIRFDTLDNYVAHHEVARIDLLKIDVDGYEARVIRGGIATLRRDHPLLCVELAQSTLDRLGDDLEVLLRTLREAGYAVYHLDSLKELSDNEVLRLSASRRYRDFMLSCDPIV